MKQFQHNLQVQAPHQGLFDITRDVASWAGAQGIATGLLTLFLHHTSASLVIQENADPDVLRDLDAFLQKLVPEDPSLYRHTAEGPDDMPAHIKAALTQTHVSIPLSHGRLALGTWQGIYLFEHRRRPSPRRLTLHLSGE